MQVAILYYSGAVFGPRASPFFVWQTGKLSATNQQWILSLYTKHLMDIFKLGDLQLLGSTQFFTSYRDFPLITLLLATLYCLFFKAWKAIESLTWMPDFLFSAIYFSLLFNFKIGSSLVLSCLMSSMFIIILIFFIFKTTCFNNIILMANLEGKFP